MLDDMNHGNDRHRYLIIGAQLVIVTGTLALLALMSVFTGLGAYALLLPFAVLAPVIFIAILLSLWLMPGYLEHWGTMPVRLRMLVVFSLLCSAGWLLLFAVAFLM